MKILFLTDYFYPYIHGGAETSISLLAEDLVRKGIDIFLLTPNYGSKIEENYHGIKIFRFPFPTKLKKHSDQLTPLWHFNPLYWYRFTKTGFKLIKENNIEVIHCQSAGSIIPGIFMGWLLKKKVVITFRDNQVLCNYGYCLTKNQFGKTCDFKTFLNEDFKHYYYDKVVDKNVLTFFVQLALGIQGRIRSNLLKYFSKFASRKVVGSKAQQKTFSVNGVEDTVVINNIHHFEKNTKIGTKINNDIIYATKLSSGKGLDMLLNSMPKVLKQYPKIKLKIFGGGDSSRYKLLTNDLQLGSSIEFSDRLPPEELKTIRKHSLLEITPSVYPESFGRSALEALSLGLPVIATNRGGLTDIVENNVSGFIVEANTDSLASGIINGIRDNKRLRNNISKKFNDLRYKFEDKPLNDYINLYKSIL